MEEERSIRVLLERLFSNIGSKLKIVAKINVVLTIIISAIIIFGGLISNNGNYYYEPGYMPYIISTVAILIIGFIQSFIMYGFGQIVEDLHYIKEHK